MADPRRKTRLNVEGEFFVDATCIDCDTCRQLAPATFEDDGGHSFVKRQPDGPEQERAALRALLACPTGSIGTLGPNRAGEVRADFPLPIAGGVSYLGFTSPHSFGGSSYLVERANGNWMIDAPKFTRSLVSTIEARGGLSRIFLTHSDDVADAARWAEHFGARRIIHRRELRAQPDAEIVVEGIEPVVLPEPDASPVHATFTVIPTPGHTAGHCSLLFAANGGETFLFNGDHAWWSRKKARVWASRDVCWHDWGEQTASIERLLVFDIDWLLPGHGERRHLGRERMRAELARLVADMKA